jgi:hypothetical protein
MGRRQAFDVSDVVVIEADEKRETHSEVLDSAVRVLGILGGTSQDDAARLARWVLLNAGCVVSEKSAGAITRFDVGAFTVWRVANLVGLGPSGSKASDADVKGLEPNKVRELMTALARAQCLADSED